MNPVRRALLALLIMATAGAACTYIPPPYTPPVDPPPAHYVYGDSLAWQASSFAAGDGRIWRFNGGWDLTMWEGDVLASLATRPASIVLALGTNDAGTWDGRDGWTASDVAIWTDVLNHVDPATRVVIVLPYITADAGDVNVAEVAEARTWLAAQNAVIVDWADYAQPGMFLDGIHVNSGYEHIRYEATIAGDPL